MATQSPNLDLASTYEVYTSEVQKALEKVVCLRCGRPLTNEKSRQARLGPKCARRLVYETRTKSYSVKTLQYSKIIQESSTQRDAIPTQAISLYYSVNSSHKPYCKIGTVSLPAADSWTTDRYNCRKKVYSLPLFEGVIYELSICLPQSKVFLLQVQSQQLKDISNSIK